MKAEPGAKIVRTCAPLSCGPGCGLLAHVKDGVLVKVEPGDFPGTSHVCAKCLSAVKWVYHPDRLKYPMKRQGARGEGRWQRITWDEALDTIAHRLRDISNRHGSRSVAWTIDSMAILATMALEGLIGAFQGTFLLPAGYGDTGGTCSDIVYFGSQWWFGEDYTTRFERPALCLNWGGNPVYTDSFSNGAGSGMPKRGERGW